MKQATLLTLMLLSVFLACTKIVLENTDLISYVNPFVGTGGHGHTYPGATMPFGMMQLSPDTRLEGWDGCSGYHYTDQHDYRFSHTHLSGTGILDYGDVLLMPTNEVVFNNGADGKKGYRSSFSHDNEVASPGIMQYIWMTQKLDVSLTVSERSGIHQCTFQGSEQIVILDLVHRDLVIDSGLDLIDEVNVRVIDFQMLGREINVYFSIWFFRDLQGCGC